MLNRYVILEQNIPYDWDDYDVYKSFYYDTHDNCVVMSHFGHGNNDEYANNCVELVDGIANIDINSLIDGILEKLPYNIDVDVLLTSGTNFNIPCSVVGGRKLKGDLTFVKKVVSQNRYVPSYHRDREVIKYVVYDDGKKQYCDVNPSYVKFNINMRDLIHGAISKDSSLLRTLIHCLAYKVSYSSCDRRNLVNSLAYIIYKGFPSEWTEEIDLSVARNPWQEKIDGKKKARIDAKQAEARPKVEAWARSLGKSAEETEQIIQRTLDKYYS